MEPTEIPVAPLDIPAKTFLPNQYFVLPGGLVFIDKVIPSRFDKSFVYSTNMEFSMKYFVELHNHVKLFGTYNFSGARVKLHHNKINVSAFRKLLPHYFEDLAILQYLEFGFPLGLNEDYDLMPVLKNHSSSYNYFTHIDKFIATELNKTGLTGPFMNSPFELIMTSPLMTAVKKPSSRRAVFDASFGDYSLNVNTPHKSYIYDEYDFSFPKVDDFANLILRLGKGCFMWKRDLSRFFLQLPLDPLDYDKVGFVWRSKLWFFTSYVWGCRHAGMNGQRVSSAVASIHRSLGYNLQCKHRFSGCSPECPHLTSPTESLEAEPFNSLNYSDDFAGGEVKLARSHLAFNTLGTLLEELMIDESKAKAVSPSQILKYLGIEFDSLTMEMRVDKEKCDELRIELASWCKRSVATKTEIQSILGKLMWVAKAVKLSRCFVLRIIAESKSLSTQKQKSVLSEEIKKDLLWWYTYLLVFNGTELLIPDTVQVQIAGDACPTGLGCCNFEVKEYFSRKFPRTLCDPKIPIHIKEFICVIISARIWGESWTGKRVEIFCDNDSVCDVISFLKPKDSEMQRHLREFLYWVCRYNFQPVVSKIGTKENHIADFVSRNFSQTDAENFFTANKLSGMKNLEVGDEYFSLVADW